MSRRPIAMMFAFLIAGTAWPARGQPLPLAASLTNGLSALAKRESERLPDPFPIRRVLLPENAPWPAAPDGDPFRKTTRDEFERLVRAAARNAPAQPKLVRADYRAALDDDALTGTGEWLFATEADGAFALDPLRLAVRGAKWSDGREARVYGTPAKLWVEPRGRSPVAFAWSARGIEEPGAIRFNLGVPAAPLAVLELELPADRVPVVKAGSLLDGPVAKSGNRSAWRIAFGGESTLDFALRSAAAGRPEPFTTVGRTMKWDLTPGLASLACEFDVASLRDAPSRLEFLVDAGLAVSDVTAAGLEGWRVHENRLTLAFREPFAGGKVAVAAVAPLPTGDSPWTMPGIHIPNGSPTVDLVELLVGPELRLDGSEPGDFRPIRSASSERGYSLTFRGILPAEGTLQRRLPALRPRGVPAEFSTVETMDWRIESQRTLLTARIRAAVARGPLARLVVRVPAGATPVAAVVAPDDPTATFTALGGDRWAIEPTQPVATGETIDVRLALRGAVPAFDAARNRARLPLLHPAPVGAVRREGTATIQLAPDLRGWLANPAPASFETGTETFRYSRDPDAELTLAHRRTSAPEQADPEPRRERERAWRFSDLAATATIEPDGSARVELTGRILASSDRVLPVTLPPGAALESVRIDGKWADPSRLGETVRLPMPEPDADGIAIAMTYRLPARTSWPRRLDEIRPELPGSPPIRATVGTSPNFRVWPRLAESTSIPAILVPTNWLGAIGFGFAAILLGALIGPLWNGSAGGRIRIALGLLVAALGSAIWLAPDGWRLVVAPPLAVALVGLFGVSVRARSIRPAALVALALVPAGAGVAQAPAAVTVYFVADSPGDPNRLSVLAPQSLLARLADLAAPHLPAVLLTDAEYAGAEADGLARFEATWRIEVTRGGTHDFELPLSGVKLESMTLDGAAAFPDAAKPNRYRIAVTGIGVHALKAAFAVPITSVAGDREAKFGVPDLPSSRVALALPAGGQPPELTGRVGGRRIVREGDRTRWLADLGPGGTIAIRWRGADATAPTVSVQEATIWTANETRAEAVATFLHLVERGAVTRLAFDLPAGLEPGQFSVRELDTPGSTNGLKDWLLEPAPAGSRLTLVLRQPARGRIATTFRLASRGGPTNRPAFAMPRSATGDTTASYLGVRLAGVVAENWQLENLIDIPTDIVAREFASVPDFEFDRTLARSLRREGAKPPLARPTLRVAPIPAPTASELVWTLGAQAEVVGSAQWSGTAVPFAEFDVPAAVAVADVGGAELAGWERTGTRIRAWFKSDVRDPSLKWSGSWSGFAPSTPLELPSVPGATVRVRPLDDVALRVPGERAVQFLTPTRPRERAYVANPATPAPKFVVEPSAVPTVKQSESLERAGNGFEHRATFDVPLAARRPAVLALAVKNLPSGVEPRLEWPTGTVAVEAGSSAGVRRWIAEFAERAEPSLRISVVARLPRRSEIELLEVELQSGNVPLPRSERRLELPDDLRPAPGQARRDANGWLVIADGPVRLMDVPTLLPVIPVQPSEDAVESPAESPASPGREWFAVAWLTGLALIGIVARWGSASWRPELLVGYGALAVSVAGWAFAGIAVVGLGLRLAVVARAVGRRALR